MKKCLNCESEFAPSKNDERIKYCCEKCRVEYRKKIEYMKNYYQKNKESKYTSRQKTPEYKDLKNKKRRERYKTDAVYREREKQKTRDYNNKHPNKKLQQHLNKYNMTISDYESMYNTQNGKCAICGNDGDKNNKYRPLYIDHDHKTGKVRGLLCSKCNFLLGNSNDDVNILLNAIEYLGGSNERKMADMV